MELLADEMVRLTQHKKLSAETVRRRLVEKELKPWQKKMWCIPKVDAEFVARMEDVLDLYAEPPDKKRPVVCFDETPRQLIGEARVPVAAKPGKPARVDYEYVRNGTANVFMFFDAHRKWRHAKVTDRRASGDFAAILESADPLTGIRAKICERLNGGCAEDGRLWAEITAAAHRKPQIARICGQMEELVAENLLTVFARLAGTSPKVVAQRYGAHARFIVMMVKAAAMRKPAAPDPDLTALILRSIESTLSEILAARD